MVVDKQKIFNDIQELVGEQLKVVSFKWLARHFSVPANTAKKVLSEFLEKNQGKVSATYLISGWTKGPEPEHSIQLVDAGSLTERRKKLDPITSLHVYSVQPTQPKDASELWNTDNVQTMEFFISLVKSGGDNCLADNRWSAVQCQQAKRDPSVSKGKAQAARMPSDPPPAPTTPANGVVAAIKNAAAGKGGKEKKERKDPAAAVAEKAAVAPAAASAPSATHSRAVAAAKALTGGGGKKKGAALSAMWSKAPPKKAKDSASAASAKAAEEKSKSTAAVDAEAALRLNGQAESSSESEEEQAPIQRVNPGRRGRVLHDEPADSDADSPVQPPSKRPRSGNGAAQKKSTVLNESDDDSDWEVPKKTAGRGGGKSKQAGPAEAAPGGSQAAAADSQEPEAEEEGQKKGGKRAAEKKKAGAKAGAAKRPSPGTIKVHDEATGGPKRKKVLRTTYNDKGEEVTEMVYEDEPAAEPAHAASEPQENKEGVEGAAAPAKQEAEPAVQPAAPATKASSQSQGSAGAPPRKEPAKAGAKKAKDKIVPGQRGIKSFFAKK